MKTLCGLTLLFLVSVLSAQKPGATPKFEIVSLKTGVCGAGKIGPQGPPADWVDKPMPSHLRFCANLANLIKMAYWRYDGGHLSAHPLGGPKVPSEPAWIISENYMLDAKTAEKPSQETMRGPMLRAVLEDRFKLRLHRETRQADVYELQISKGGPKLERFVPGSCSPPRHNWRFDQPPASGPHCPEMVTRNADAVIRQEYDVTLDEFSDTLSSITGRTVNNKTGLAGEFNFKLAYTPANGTGNAANASVITAVKQLGLELIPVQGPEEFFVIDHVERAASN